MNEIWDVIFEQNQAKEILTKICNSRRVPHAFLFYGKEGVGKFFTAIQFAKLLNEQTDSARSRAVIKKISTLQEPYIKLIIPLPRGRGETGEDSATEKLSKEILEQITTEIRSKIFNPYYKIKVEDANSIKINSIREIKKFVNTSVDEIAYRFIILLDAHMMNEQAQNALLKNLEEPPEGIIFILITSDKEKMLPTIQSRCWEIDFEPLSVKSVQNILIKYFLIVSDLAEKISHFSEGTPLTCLDMINVDFDKILEKTVSFLRFAIAKRYNSAYSELISFINEESNGSIKILTRLIKSWLNDVVRNKYSISDYYLGNYIDTFEKFNARFSQTNIYNIFSMLDNLDVNQNKNLNLNIACLNLIFELASISIRK